VSRARPNPWKRLPYTGIGKRPVTGPVAVAAPGPKGDGAVGLAGDRAYDVKHHGGADQAVYAYAREDLAAWTHGVGVLAERAGGPEQAPAATRGLGGTS
jgi:MOSC domain-containing protein YiiM